ncbi:AfsA-related hotdog domain-containing protein [Agrobacterium sp. BT-220-3]|nr:AfsA-related hotdog domain-containing protein [Agrobacterium sp. BT-220-3]
MSVFVVVSDHFSDFSKHCGALSLSEACDKMRDGDFELDDLLVAGQGLSEAEKAAVETLAHRSGATQSLALWNRRDMPSVASLAITHKHRLENILISTPVLVASDCYRSQLILSAQNELLLDHATGQHVQGMVLIEACRQMFIAVSELGHMGDVGNRKSYVVFNDIAARFHAFTFPLPAEIEYQLTTLDETRPDRVVISAALSVWQNGDKTTEIIATYSLFESGFLQPKEMSKGAAAVRAFAGAAQESVRPQALAG